MEKNSKTVVDLIEDGLKKMNKSVLNYNRGKLKKAHKQEAKAQVILTECKEIIKSNDIIDTIKKERLKLE